VSQIRFWAWNASRKAAKGAKKGGEVVGFGCFRARLDPRRASTRERVRLPPPLFAASRLRVSQSRFWAWNASREAAKGAKEGGKIIAESREQSSGDSVRNAQKPNCGCHPKASNPLNP
jgi:hypothetical protein